MQTENIELENEHQKLIRSEEFDQALLKGSDIKSEISGTMKQRSKNNYERFYEVMLLCNPEIQSICDKRKKDRTDEESNRLKKFIKETKTQYKLARDMMFLSEDDKLNDDGTTNTVPKKLMQLVDKISLVHALLKYVGYDVLDKELLKRGIMVASESFENKSEAFENEQIKNDITETLTESCKIQGDIESAERSIREDVFPNMVPVDLQFDKNTNPGGIRDSDFKKLVEVKFKLVKSEQADVEAQEKASEKAFDEAEKKTFEIQRNKTMRAGLIALGAESSPKIDGEVEFENEQNND